MEKEKSRKRKREAETEMAAKSWDTMPDLILLKVFTSLDFKNRIRVGGVCSQWRRLIDRSFEIAKYVDLKVVTRLTEHTCKCMISDRPVAAELEEEERHELNLYLESEPSIRQWGLHDLVLSRVSPTLIVVSLYWPSLAHILNTWNPPPSDSSRLFPRVGYLTISFVPGEFDGIEQYDD